MKLFNFFKSLSNRFVFNLVSSLIVGLSVSLLVLAFNNPLGNPPTGTGAIIGVGSGAPASSLYIDSSGDVGIGTVGPLANLHLKPSSGDATFRLEGATINDGGLFYIYGGGTAIGRIRTGAASAKGMYLSGDGSTDHVFIKSDGNVGIGTLNPAIGKLQINTGGASNNALTIQASTQTSATFGFGINTNNDLAIKDNLADTIPFAIKQNSGNVGIGNANPAYKLDVNGNVNATAYYGSGANLTGVTVADNSISTAKLKTATGEVSFGPAAFTVATLPGGEYGFFPQLKGAGAWTDAYAILSWTQPALSTSYRTQLVGYSASGTFYAQQRYVTASGQDMWIFLLVDKTTKEIIQAYQAPDHPAYGNGGDFDKMPHPFADYNSNIQEIILIEKDQAKAIQQEAKEKI